MKKYLFKCIILISIVNQLSAQIILNNDPNNQEDSKTNLMKSEKNITKNLTHWQVLKYPMISTGINVAMVGSAGFLDSADVADVDVPLWFNALITAEHMPLYAQDKKLAMKYSISHASLIGGHYLSKNSPTLTLVPFNAHIKTAMFSTYESYKISRRMAKPGIYQDELQEQTIGSLSLAPFKLENLKRPIFYIPFGLSAIFQVKGMLDSDDAIWKTNKVYVDNEQMNASLAVPLVTAGNMINNLATAVGEEALYRGVIYEELKSSFGSRRAKCIDFFLFPAIHVPQDLARKLEPGEITGLFLMRGVSTLFFDYAYDKGGLPLSVTLHTWLNMLGYTTRWLGSSGVPQKTDNTKSTSVSPNMSFGISIAF